MKISSSAYNNKSDKQTAFCAKPMPFEVASKMKTKILDSAVRDIDVYCHASPDEDTVNSMKVDVNWLKRLGKSFSVCVNKRGSKDLYFKPENYPIKKGAAPVDLALILDFNGEERVPKKYLDNFKQARNVIGFDHHEKAGTFIESGDIYRDTSAKSNCSIVYRFFESLGELDKLSQEDYKSLYCGMLSDFSKSKLVEISDNKLQKLDRLYEDKNKDSREILEKVEAKLSESDKTEIYKHLDIISNLTKEETNFRKRLFRDIQYTPSGKLAYVVIKPGDEQWIKLGRDNPRTSTILNDFRRRIVSSNFPQGYDIAQKKNLQNVKGAIVFYSVSTRGPYKMSISSKGSYAESLRLYIKTHLDPKLEAGGHSNRQGGSAASMEPKDIEAFINSFLTAAEKAD